MKNYKNTILIVEDDENDRLLLERAFRKIGVKDPIHLLSDGMEAIAYMMGEGKYADRAQYCYPTFVMTDLKMQHADGFAVLEFLKKNPDWAIIPTVVLSSSSDHDDIKRAYRLGASSYHVKESNPQLFLEQIKVLHAYWMTCEVPAVDATGKQLDTDSRGKLGERFQDDSTTPEQRSELASSMEKAPNR